MDYSDGRIREFNTQSYLSNGPDMGRDSRMKGGRNYLTEFDLRLDHLEDEGLRLDLYYTFLGFEKGQMVNVTKSGELDPERTREGQMVEVGTRYLRGTFILITPAELEHAENIIVKRGDMPIQAAWRQGSGRWLVNGGAFSRAARQYYTDQTVTSINSQALHIVRYITNASPTTTTEEAALQIGFPPEAFEELVLQETQNNLADQGPDPESEQMAYDRAYPPEPSGGIAFDGDDTGQGIADERPLETGDDTLVDTDDWDDEE